MMRWCLLPVAAVAASGNDCCWCDPDTPDDSRTTQGSDSASYELIFSDEFNKAGRNFANGQDAKWTALNVGDTSNKGTAFYLPEQASIATDDQFPDTSALLILTENASHTGDSPTGEKGIYMPYRSAMLQSWNKFCFTGGIVEFRARMPRGGGYWPALWLFGNLGRAVYQNSNTGLWPWSYDVCSDKLELPPTDPPQRISACQYHDLEKEGLHPYQGRGATELDVLEGAVTNAGSDSYVVGSLQLSPGLPSYFKPPLFGFPTSSGAGSWYTGLRFGEHGLPNNGWYGPPWGSDCPTGCPDALSGGLTHLDTLDTAYWTYRMEWFTGDDGALNWYYDGEFVWGMSASSFGEYEVCSTKAGGEKACKTTPKRNIPQEPMSLVMNTAIGTWNGGQTALDGKHWPAKFFVDYVRVYQRPDAINIGCDPPDFPTKKYIDLHAEWYGEAASPSGEETCAASYPKSAYDNAAQIEARAQAIQAMVKGGAKAAAVADLATAFAAVSAAGPAPAASGYGMAVPLAGLVVLLVAAAAGAARWWEARASGGSRLLGAGEYDEFTGAYELAEDPPEGAAQRE